MRLLTNVISISTEHPKKTGSGSPRATAVFAWSPVMSLIFSTSSARAHVFSLPICRYKVRPCLHPDLFPLREKA